MKKIIALGLAVCVAGGVFTGCGSNKVTDVDSKMLNIDFSKYSSSDEIPDWDGDDLSIVKWVQASNPNSTLNKSYSLKNDPITKEIKRITGVDYNLDESFDNAGSSFDAVVAKLIATDTFPHVAEGIPDISSLVKNEYLWNIEDYVKKYAPTVYKMFGPDSPTLYGDLWKRQKENYGGVYELAIGASGEPLRPLAEAGVIDIDMEKLDKISAGSSAYPTVKVRDDILKQLYPQAHTAAELEAIYNEKGEFAEEEIFDVPINSPEDFVDMLNKIKDLHLKNGSNEVYATFTHVGMDNWAILQQMGAMFGHVSASNPSLSYFSYYDKKTNELKPTFKEPWFKDMLREYNGWIRNGIASEEALVDTNNVFKEKLNNGNYIVCYGSYTPSESQLAENLHYRPVYGKYKVDTDSTLFVESDYTSYNRYTFFKDTLSEKQLIQLMRMFEFLVSDAGEKLCFWGTKDMGLYSEDENGNISFTDEDVKNQATNQNKYGFEKIAPLGLKGEVWPGRIMNYTTKYYPQLVYADEIQTWLSAYNAAKFGTLETVPGMMPTIYAGPFLNEFEEIKNFWNARNGFEEAMLKIFAAGSDDEFEKKYNDMVKYAENNGLTDDVYKEATKWYKEEYNKDYMQYVK